MGPDIYYLDMSYDCSKVLRILRYNPLMVNFSSIAIDSSINHLNYSLNSAAFNNTLKISLSFC